MGKLGVKVQHWGHRGVILVQLAWFMLHAEYYGDICRYSTEGTQRSKTTSRIVRNHPYEYSDWRQRIQKPRKLMILLKCSTCVEGEIIITNKSIITNKFYSFFTNTGLNLSAKINIPRNQNSKLFKNISTTFIFKTLMRK